MYNYRDNRRLRIVFAGPEIAGHYSNLQVGFRRIGINVDLCTLPNRFDYVGDYCTAWQVRLYRKFNIKRTGTHRKQFFKKIFYVAGDTIFSKVIMPLWAAFSYDILFFGFGMTFSNSKLELRLYRLFRRKVIFTFYGTDARAAYLSGARFPASVEIPWAKVAEIAENTKRMIERIEHYADYIMAFPSVSHLFSRKFVDISLFGNPVSIEDNGDENTMSSTNMSRPVRILHGPSNPASKGSKQILEIITRLRDKGHAIEYMPVHGVKNAEMIEAIRDCDFVVDSLWSDCPAGVFPSEAAFLGKPVVMGGYFAKHSQEYYIENEMPPYVYVHPDDVEASIERLIVDVGYRLELGKRLQNYMRSHRRPEQIAGKYLQIIRGDIPDRWWFDPYRICYVHGSGAPECHIKELVRGLIQKYGVEMLQLGDKPELEKAFLEFAGITCNEQ